MSQLKQAIFFLLLLMTVSQVQAAAYILQAEGHGDDVAQAKASALTNLSQQVISRIESEFTSDVTVSNEDVNKNIRTKKKVTSQILFKNVKYSDQQQDGSGVRIVAGLDREAVEDTVSFMREKLQQDFDLLNWDQLDEALVISQQLSALLFSISQSGVVDEALTPWTDQRREELLKRLNQTRVVFISDVADYRVEVDGREVHSGEFFPQGSYSFVASAKGYREVNGRFSASPGKTVKIDLPFIDKVAGQQVMVVIHGGNEALRQQAIETLAGLGMNVIDEATQRVDLTFSDDVTEVEGFVNHDLKLKLIAYKGKTQVKKITAKKKLTLSGDDPTKVLVTQQRLAHKGIMALLADIDLHDYFKP